MVRMRYSDFVIILQIDSLYPALPGDEIKSAKLFIFSDRLWYNCKQKVILRQQ